MANAVLSNRSLGTSERRPAAVVKLSVVRAAIALDLAQQLVRRVQFKVVGQRETGDLMGHPAALEGICLYVGINGLDCSRWSVWLPERYRNRVRVLMRSAARRGARAAG
jgi:hypothetical protein